jgi:hypothetical protein
MFRRRESLLDRRRFLRAVGSMSTGAVAASVSLTAAEEAQAYDPGKQETRARYRADSPDVEAFYRTNGYETLKKK